MSSGLVLNYEVCRKREVNVDELGSDIRTDGIYFAWRRIGG